MNEIVILPKAGSFAENKDVAREIRVDSIMPALKDGKEIVIDFEGVESATQSFIHALISDVLRKYGSGILDRITFKNCNENVKKIITMVSDYMQESENGG